MTLKIIDKGKRHITGVTVAQPLISETIVEPDSIRPDYCIFNFSLLHFY